MKIREWYTPKLKEYSIEEIIRQVSANASSLCDFDSASECDYDVVKEQNKGECVTNTMDNNSEWTDALEYCLNYGPLNGCDNFFFCSDTGYAILSNDDEVVIE